MRLDRAHLGATNGGRAEHLATRYPDDGATEPANCGTSDLNLSDDAER